MPGRNPHEAVHSFLEPLREALAVLDGYSKILVRTRGGFEKDKPYIWVLNGEEGMSLPDVGRFHATMMFQVIDCDPATNEGHHRLRVTTLGYNYKLADAEGRDLIRFHWHPRGEGVNLHPHVHALPNLDTHFYMPRVTFEDAIRACMSMGAPLTVDAGEATRHLAMTEAPHMLYRTWSDWPPGRDEPYRRAVDPPRSE